MCKAKCNYGTIKNATYGTCKIFLVRHYTRLSGRGVGIPEDDHVEYTKPNIWAVQVLRKPGLGCISNNRVVTQSRKISNEKHEIHILDCQADKKGAEERPKKFPKDKAAGVGILLSKRAHKKIHSFGSEGERVCWVRLKGPTCDLFIVAVYMPHRGGHSHVKKTHSRTSKRSWPRSPVAITSAF